MSDYKKYVDVSKILGMLLLVINHAGLWRGWDKTCGGYWFVKVWICSFHMELFFFLHGLTSAKEIGTFKSLKLFFISSIKRIVVPYILWCMIYSKGFGIRFWVFIIYGSNQTIGTVSNGVLWFLPTLMVASMINGILNAFNRRFGDKIILEMIECFLFAISFFCLEGVMPVYGFPCGIQVALLSVPLMRCGRLLKCFVKIIYSLPNIQKILLGSSLFSAGFLVAQFNVDVVNGVVVTALGDVGNVILYYLISLINIFGLLIISMLLENIDILSYMGRGSLLFMAAHYLWFEIVIGCLDYFDISLHWVVELFILTTICFLLFIPVYKLCQRYLPEVNGN